MQFYSIDGIIVDREWSEQNNDRRIMKERARTILARSNTFNQKLSNKIYYYVSEMTEDTVSIGVICDDETAPAEWLKAYLKAIRVELKNVLIEETTFNRTENMLRSAERGDFIYNDSDVLERFELDKLQERYNRSVDYDEKIVDKGSKTAVYKEAERILSSEALVPELDRIYAGRAMKSVGGHPVHYIVQTDEEATRWSMCRLLLQALYSNERLRSRRYCSVNLRHDERFSVQYYDYLYKSNKGGVIVVKLEANVDEEDDHANAEREVIEKLCMAAKKYRINVLTIFCLPRECTKTKEIFYENLDNMSFVELKEEFVGRDRAKEYLKMLAGKNKIRSDKRLFGKLEEKEEYLTSDLTQIFSSWYNEKLKISVYPQYNAVKSVKAELIKKEPKGTAYEELEKMIGLNSAKKVIKQALDYYKAQQVFADKGMKNEKASMHMVFTGNPGTAKTTVARLFSRIMKENGLLSQGKLIEVGRGDLVGKYVGWTAPTIQKKFKEAMGSVLFIDEAYSLVDDRSGSYGDEAINTIVQEMENHRNDVVVIFAGYPDKMEGFLNKNPGLRSRIVFHVSFDDYSTEDLCGIAGLIAEEKGLVIADDAYEKMSGIFREARKREDFGNGRYARNLIERARMAQSSRLLKKDYESVKKDDVMTILAEDIEEPCIEEKKNMVIGFSA